MRLSAAEQAHYDGLIVLRNAFLARMNIQLGSIDGWKSFVMQSGTPEGRRAMLAHREARALAYGTEGKLRVLEEVLANHPAERSLIFTDDNATVYRVSREFLIPAITHQTPVKERHTLLQAFREGRYRTLVTSRVLNEGVDVPEASVAVVLSGTATEREHIQRLGRILRKVTGKQATLYEVVTEGTAEGLAQASSWRRWPVVEGFRETREQPIRPTERSPLFLSPCVPPGRAGPELRLPADMSPRRAASSCLPSSSRSWPAGCGRCLSGRGGQIPPRRPP